MHTVLTAWLAVVYETVGFSAAFSNAYVAYFVFKLRAAGFQCLKIIEAHQAEIMFI